jgi:hypothetical protein
VHWTRAILPTRSHRESKTGANALMAHRTNRASFVEHC